MVDEEQVTEGKRQKQAFLAVFGRKAVQSREHDSTAASSQKSEVKIGAEEAARKDKKEADAVFKRQTRGKRYIPGIHAAIEKDRKQKAPKCPRVVPILSWSTVTMHPIATAFPRSPTWQYTFPIPTMFRQPYWHREPSFQITKSSGRGTPIRAHVIATHSVNERRTLAHAPMDP